MAKERRLNTKLWSDSWVRTINPLDRYLFIYLLTNEHTDLCGIYELPLDTLAHETGIKENDLQSSYFPKLKPKVYYYESWVIIPNFVKHQNIENEKIIAGIKRSLALIPKKILDKAIGYGYPMDRLSHLDSDLDLDLNSKVETNVSNIPLKAKRVQSKTEFNFKDLMTQWSTMKNEYRVYHHYFTYRKIELLSKAEVDRFNKTYYKSASIIKKYSLQRMERVFAFLNEKKNDDWSLWNVSSEISNKKYE